MSNWQESFTKFYQGRAKIQQLAELTAVEDLKLKAAELRRNSEAESAAVRRKLWGESAGNQVDTDKDMGTTVLGDITHPAPIIMPPPPQQNNTLATLALIAASAVPIGVGGAAIGYLLSQKHAPEVQQPATPQFSDETVSIGLGRIEDYVNDNEAE